MSSVQDLDVCPSCGKFATLLWDSGWCSDCSPGSFCNTCGKKFCPDQPTRVTCSTCRLELWLTNHADDIEDLMVAGLSFRQAEKQIRAEIKTICISCGVVLANHKGRLCNENQKCRSITSKAYYNHKYKGMNKETALREALLSVNNS